MIQVKVFLMAIASTVKKAAGAHDDHVYRRPVLIVLFSVSCFSMFLLLSSARFSVQALYSGALVVRYAISLGSGSASYKENQDDDRQDIGKLCEDLRGHLKVSAAQCNSESL